MTAASVSPGLPEPAGSALPDHLLALLAGIGQWLSGEQAFPAGTAAKPGIVQERVLHDDWQQRYFIYVPHERDPAKPLFVAIHGISRNAREHAEQFSGLAERYGVAVIAPLFDEQRFPDYQRLGRRGRGARADLMLERIVDECATLIGADARRFCLFGYSGGGQFAHRFALAHPHRIAAYAIAAAGWYTLPDPSQRFPMGTGGSSRLTGIAFHAEEFLTVPAAVFVGERDVYAGSALRQSEQLSDSQGENRFERGRHWVTEMTRAARQQCLDTEYHFEALPRSPHCFVKSMRRGKLGERVFTWLFNRTQAIAADALDECAGPHPAIPATDASPAQGIGMSGL